MEQITSADGKLGRTLITLIARPGELTVDHLAGRRARYLRPIQLFLLVNVFLFIAAPHVPLFSYSLEKYLRFAPPSPVLVNELIRRVTPSGHTHDASAGGVEFVAYQQKFDSLVDTQRKSFIIVLAPALALLFAAIFRKRNDETRGPTRFGEHLIFSLHLLTFVWLVLAGVGLIERLARGVLRLQDARGIVLILIATALLSWCALYLLRSLRNVYALEWSRTIGVAALTIAAFLGLLIVYRGLLFFTTYYAL